MLPRSTTEPHRKLRSPPSKTIPRRLSIDFSSSTTQGVWPKAAADTQPRAFSPGPSRPRVAPEKSRLELTWPASTPSRRSIWGALCEARLVSPLFFRLSCWCAHRARAPDLVAFPSQRRRHAFYVIGATDPAGRSGSFRFLRPPLYATLAFFLQYVGSAIRAGCLPAVSTRDRDTALQHFGLYFSERRPPFASPIGFRGGRWAFFVPAQANSVS